jgi:S1-C subfamily serine protease
VEQETPTTTATTTPMTQPKTGTGGCMRALLHGLGYSATALAGLIFGGLLMLVLVASVSGVGIVNLLQGNISSGKAGAIAANPKSSSSDQTVAVVKKLEPSIVNVRTTSVISDAFHNSVQGQAEGSGVVYRSDGYILTNNHVIDGATQITVTIGTEDVTATVVGADAETDIAVLKVNKTGLTAAELGSSKTLQVGEMAVAIGSPFGFEHTVTTGVISGLNRTIQPDATQGTTYTGLIQTDAAINPGNSGGALANGKGQVVGINSIIYSQSGGSEGVGFAIPIETAKLVADQIINKGNVTHPYIGIVGQTVDDTLAKQNKLPVTAGAIIQSVVAGSPADKAGLKKADILVKIDGETIKAMPDVVSVIRGHAVGDKLTVSYYRGKVLKETTITLADKPKA